MAALRVARSGFTGTPVTTTALRVARTGFTGTVAVLLDPIPNQTVDPVVSDVTTVNAVLTGGGTADSYTFRRVSGVAATLSATGGTCTFPTPAVFGPNNSAVVIGATATTSGLTSPERLSTVTVLPTLRWVWDGAKFVPARRVTAVSGIISVRNYPAATPLVNGTPWEQVQLPRVRGTIVPRINGLNASIPGTVGPSGLAVPSSAMKVELFAHSHNDVTSTTTAAASATDLTISLDTGTVPVFALDFLLNNRTQEKLRATAVSGTTVTVIRGTQGYSAPAAILSGDTFLINGGDVSDSGGNYDTSRSEVRGDYATPSSTVPRLWPHPYNSVRFLDFQIMLPTSLFPTPTGTDWVVLTQWKGQYGGSPPVSLEASTAGTFKLQLGSAPDINFGNLTRNVWHRITLGALLSPDPTVGWVEVWFEGVNVIPRQTVATMEYQTGTTTPDPVYLKQGIYKPKEWVADHTAYFGPLTITTDQPAGLQ